MAIKNIFFHLHITISIQTGFGSFQHVLPIFYSSILIVSILNFFSPVPFEVSHFENNFFSLPCLQYSSSIRVLALHIDVFQSHISPETIEALFQGFSTIDSNYVLLIIIILKGTRATFTSGLHDDSSSAYNRCYLY